MNKTVLLLLLLASMLTLSSCQKDEDAQPLPTSLEITLKDNLGNNVSGAAVKLYSSESDWINGTNQVGVTQFSDGSGKVKFTNLSNIKYYWFVEKDCQNNVNGSITSTSALTANINNLANVILTSTGTLRFVSNSSNPYRIFINGTAAFDMNGNTIETRSYMPTGSYSVRVLQLSGYIFTPTDQTYTGTLSCGGTLTTTFP